jgi:hypothetical protein
MKLSVHADIALDAAASGSSARVTWFEVKLEAEPGGRTCATARIAIVHVGEIADAGADIARALREAGLGFLGDAYFHEGWYRDDFADGAGIDLLFVESVTVEEVHRTKNLDLAMVRRLCDTLGSGCQLVVMPYRDAAAAGRWAMLGFSPSAQGRMSGLMHLQLGYRHVEVIDVTGAGDFEVATIAPPRAHDQHFHN